MLLGWTSTRATLSISAGAERCQVLRHQPLIITTGQNQSLMLTTQHAVTTRALSSVELTDGKNHLKLKLILPVQDIIQHTRHGSTLQAVEPHRLIHSVNHSTEMCEATRTGLFSRYTEQDLASHSCVYCLDILGRFRCQHVGQRNPA